MTECKIVMPDCNISIIEMREMKPLEIGRIVGDGLYRECIVMRTASEDTFEVINLSDFAADSCWTVHNNLKVELIKADITVTIRK